MVAVRLRFSWCKAGSGSSAAGTKRSRPAPSESEAAVTTKPWPPPPPETEEDLTRSDGGTSVTMGRTAELRWALFMLRTDRDDRDTLHINRD
ncbi:hypothetical protein BHE74_00009072 [Ensete ventricosum]|nr:hypothetical protein GW17_00025325 [Ensete ventricosum]RWW82453.1 hypothetical protein BHE74_00009072 [Ensete ventricosum]RZR87895.1 hypothetical protein BHM03_00015374 [Ensete ventricosum]